MNNEYLSYASEIQELERLLTIIPANRLIDRISLEARLKSVRSIFASLTPVKVSPKARLTFRGKPVLGSHGMSAEFGAKAAGAFSNAFSAVVAGLTEGFQLIGPIPNKDKNQLLITGTAIGSFGFEFELPSAQPALFPETAKADEAMGKIETLLRLSAQGTDDEVAEVIEEVHPRSVKKVYEFLEILVQQHAWCGLEYAGRSFRYRDYEQLKAATARLKDDNIQETEASYQGEFQGVLPTGRTFEFKLSNQEGLIRGKVDASIDDVDMLNRDWLHKQTTVKFNVMQVGQGRPRYTLMSLDDLAG
jgi:hypothetical protein